MKKLLITAAMAFSGLALAQEPLEVIDLSGDQLESDNAVLLHHQERMNQPQKAALAFDVNAVEVVDVAVWYSPVWEDSIGTQEAIRRIDGWFSEINRGLVQSGAQIKYNPVFAKPLVWDIRGTSDCGGSEFCTTLEQYDMENVSFGYLMNSNNPGATDEPESSKTSREFGADLHLWIQSASDYDITNGPLGTAKTFGRAAHAADQSMAPIVISEDLVENGVTGTARIIMHELGHNFGLQHEKANADGWEAAGAPEYAFAWSCGQGNKPGSSTTAMWSELYRGYESRNLLSNPDVTRDGEACGDPQEADQVRHVNEYAATVASLDDRPALMGTVSFDKSKYTVLPGQNELVVNLTRTGDTSQYAEVQVVATNGGAIEGEDYLFSGQIINDGDDYEESGAVVTFQPGQSTGLATIDITNNDTSVTKTFDLALRFPLRLDTENSTAMVELQGDEGLASSGTVGVTESSIVLAENSSKEITLTRSGDTSGEAVVHVTTTDGTGTANVNYFPLNDVVRFLPGQDEATFTVYSGLTDDVSTFDINLASPMSLSFEQTQISATVNNGQNGLPYFPVTGNAEWDVCVDDTEVTTFNDNFICGFYTKYDNDTLTFPVTIERLDGSSGELEVRIFYVPESELQDDNGLPTIRQDYTDTQTPIIPASMLSWTEKTITLEDGEASRTIDIEVTDLPENAQDDGIQFLLEIEADKPLTYTYKAGIQGFYVDSVSMGGDDGGNDDGGNDDGSNDDDTGSGGGSDDSGSGETSGGSTSLFFISLLALVGIRKLKF